jgi:hypothetical protein
MAYSIYTPTGSEYAVTPLTVPDNAIDTGLYNATNRLGVQLVGRNAIDYGTAIAQNTVQLASNFAGTIAPAAARSLQGQLWFNVTSTSSGTLYVRTSTTAGGEFPSGWERVLSAPTADGDAVTVNTGATLPPTGTTGQVFILSGPTRINMWADGAWRQVFPAVYS